MTSATRNRSLRTSHCQLSCLRQSVGFPEAPVPYKYFPHETYGHISKESYSVLRGSKSDYKNGINNLIFCLKELDVLSRVLTLLIEKETTTSLKIEFVVVWFWQMIGRTRFSQAMIWKKSKSGIKLETWINASEKRLILQFWVMCFSWFYVKYVFFFLIFALFIEIKKI